MILQLILAVGAALVIMLMVTIALYFIIKRAVYEATFDAMEDMIKEIVSDELAEVKEQNVKQYKVAVATYRKVK